MFRIVLAAIAVLSVGSVAPLTCLADPGDSRAQIIARYGKPDESYENPSTHTYLDKSGTNLISESKTYTVLRFSSKDAPESVALNSEGKSVEEVYGWTEDVGQKRIVEILLRYSRGRPWRATKLDYPDTQMVWRYTQPELKLHASYERDDAGHDAIYYGLRVTP